MKLDCGICFKSFRCPKNCIGRRTLRREITTKNRKMASIYVSYSVRYTRGLIKLKGNKLTSVRFFSLKLTCKTQKPTRLPERK